ncbi:flagellar basal body-associated FliL family protein [Campylobacter sp. Cr9]|uniref:flagellar basal body-associated FliL family protein n=1 Tax=Campylobacter sp. Cr9 TaxID=2735728 RepID=UPI0030154AC4|nr:flagellar basal body-associated FliL family protein [Campylobacter sp. Cr9]
MKKFVFTLVSVVAMAGSIEISNFETDLYSKSNGLKKINLSIKVIGDNVANEKDFIQDSLNMVISSYYYEDLFTELGKENLKKTIIKYAGKKYSVNIDDILIMNLKSKDSAEAIKEILKDANLL